MAHGSWLMADWPGGQVALLTCDRHVVLLGGQLEVRCIAAHLAHVGARRLGAQQTEIHTARGLVAEVLAIEHLDAGHRKCHVNRTH